MKRSLLALMLLAACAAPETPAPVATPVVAAPAPEPGTISRTARITATVESVNMTERSVLLKLEDGSYQTVWPPKEAKNAKQVKPGDRVIATLTRSIAAEITKADASSPVAAGEAAEFAPPGNRPAGAYARAVRVRVTVNSVDTRRNTVTFTGPKGVTRTVAVQDASMQAFLKTIKKGDLVNVTVVELMTLRVLPPA